MWVPGRRPEQAAGWLPARSRPGGWFDASGCSSKFLLQERLGLGLAMGGMPRLEEVRVDGQESSGIVAGVWPVTSRRRVTRMDAKAWALRKLRLQGKGE